jgi:predicted transcriptional regulator
MSDERGIQGDLQAQIMSVVWRNGASTVEEVRSALPPRYRGAYTTVQTVLNRLADRGLLKRGKRSNAIEYTAKVSEAEYLSRSISRTLAGASSDARQVALAQLIGNLGDDEFSELQDLAKEIQGRRGKR